jgi:hypothetical protein
MDPPDDPPADLTTWHEHVAPLVAEKCVGCHRTGGIGPYAVETEDCTPRHGWREDPRLTDEQIAVIRDWFADGAPEGDPAKAAPIPQLEDTHLSGVTHRVSPSVAFTAAGDIDQMICFVLDPGITQLSWLSGIEFFPGNLEVAHHATLSAVPPERVAEVDARVGPEGWFDCFGGVGIEGLYALGVWVPGSDPFDAGSSAGIPIAAGAKVLMQMHYHPAGRTHEPDITEVAMRLRTTPPLHNLIFSGVGNAPAAPLLLPDPEDRGVPEFRVPADSGDHVESMRFPIEIEGTQRFPIMAVFPHMHYVGYDLEARIERASPAPGEPASECLFKTPHWNFDWQRTYFYDAPSSELPTVGDGDVVTITCRYNNTMDNTFVQRGLLEAGLDAPIDVFLGEQTLDEMCLAAFAIQF